MRKTCGKCAVYVCLKVLIGRTFLRISYHGHTEDIVAFSF